MISVNACASILSLELCRIKKLESLLTGHYRRMMINLLGGDMITNEEVYQHKQSNNGRSHLTEDELFYIYSKSISKT